VLRYAGRRLLQAVPLMLLVIVVTFTIIHTAPGDPVTYMYAAFNVTAEQMEVIRNQLGLNDPLHVQFLRYMLRLLRGDLGYSHVNGGPVLSLIVQRLPATLLLSLSGLALASLGGIALGVAAARRRGSITDYLVSAVSVAGYCMPVFWLGIVLVLVFAIWLKWFPSMGMETMRQQLTGLARLGDVVRHLVLPATTLGSYFLAEYARLTRASMLETLSQDFIVVARAKGLRERAVIWRHALRNSLLGIVPVLGVHVGILLVSATVTETVFAWPGLGRLTFNAVLQRDYPLLMGVFVFVGWSVIAANLVADIVCAIVDPRVRYVD